MALEATLYTSAASKEWLAVVFSTTELRQFGRTKANASVTNQRLRQPARGSPVVHRGRDA